MILSVIIATHDRCQALRDCLEGLRKVTLPTQASLEALVVANACTDATVALVRDLAPGFPFPLKLVEEPQPGLSHARNAGIQAALGAWLAFLDDDAVPDQAWAEGLAAALGSGAQLVAGRVDLGWGENARPAWLDPRLESLLSRSDPAHAGTPAEGSVDLLGANFALNRALLATTGAFDPALGRRGSELLAGEETALMAAALAQGARVVYTPAARVIHSVLPFKLEKAYFLKAAYGLGRSQVLAKASLGPQALARLLAGRAALAAWSGLAEGAARASGRQDLALFHRCQRAIAWGGLRALPAHWGRHAR